MSGRRTRRRLAIGRRRRSGADGDRATAASRPRPPCSAPSSRSAASPRPEEDEDDAVKPLPDRLVSELTAYRTLALRDAVANNPHVAMTALLHKLCLDTFQHTRVGRLSRSVGAAGVLLRSSRRT